MKLTLTKRKVQEVFNSLQSKYIRKKEFYETAPLQRSDSDNGRYALAVSNILQNQYLFDNFKRNSDYCKVLEHVNQAQGQEYLNVIRSRSNDFFDLSLSTLLLWDQIGNPRKFKFQGVDNLLSPTTLRYIKVASDLFLLFGKKLNRIAEIGGGMAGNVFVMITCLAIRGSPYMIFLS